MLDNKVELVDINVSQSKERSGPPAPRDDVSFLETQTRTRRLFSSAQIFCFALVYFGTWSGIGINMYYALLNGGPAAYLFNLIIAFAGALAQALSLGELASILPLAGAQYYWTFHFAPLKSVLNESAILFEASIQINFPDYESGGWRTTLIVLCLLLFLTVVNVWFFRIVPWFELLAGIANICFFFIVLVTLWIMSPRNDPEFILTTNFSGWENSFVSWNIGMLTQVWLFIGFEASIHMGEETKNAKRNAPMAMIYSLITNGCLGLIMVVTYIICMPPLEDIVMADYPFLYLLETSTGSKSVTTVLTVGICVVSMGTNMSSFASATLPAFFGHVSGTRRVPVRAVLLTCTWVALLAMLNLHADTFIALGAITSLCSLALFFSYAIILGVVIHLRFTTPGLPKAAFSIGRWGLPVNIFAMVWTCYMMIWLPFPTELPVTAESMNYCIAVFGTVMVGATTAWFAWAKDSWAGPNQAIVNYVLQHDGKE
ncbi:amino acid/polyamine transporter I [Microdochium trichocladiopsis]|uniref:Amino acid/polyamine transporter I n=1 Tax=Microdochium trichocladiopsis TaxID=1682393 RepID=A0A9P9BW15_9PEZI|nr:amino acid/polyamine transporter I [Microdochium trichocladiopsis]KAH7040332.1 amino acid/polyamine transporter I [Microdochium trichocladiopsis]